MAEQIAGFLERGADVRVFLDEGEMRPGESLAAKAREARMADTILVLFSRDSLPLPWPRTEWEGPLVIEPQAESVRIAFAKITECTPPRVLLPMFDLSGNSLKGLREIKRWLRRASPSAAPAPGQEVLGIAIADRPGCETVDTAAQAIEFADAFRQDFDAVFTVDCSNRTLAAQAGDLAAQLSLRLEGPLEPNLSRLGDFCRDRRFLIILESGADSPLVFGGRTSTLITRAESPNPAPDTIRESQQLFTAAPATTDWPTLCHHARQARRLLREQFRFAEIYELMTQWRCEAEIRSDTKVVDEATRELIWVLESWGDTEAARQLEYRRASEFDEQMPLPFA